MQVAAYFHRPVQTLRDLCSTEKWDMFIANTEGILRPLKFAGVVNKHSKNVALLMLADVIKMSIHFGDNEARTAALQHVYHTSKAPPPVRFGISHFGIPEVAGAAQGGPSNAATRRVVSGRAVATDKYSSYVFPTLLPEVVLLPHEMKEQYAIKNPPSKLNREIQQFIQWSGAPVNTARTGRYVRAVQTTTTDKQPARIRAYIGYISTTYGISTADLSLDIYADPTKFARFMAYLIAREVAIGHLRGHLGLARKINVFLQSGSEDGSPAKVHAARMEAWLQTVEAQLSAAMPPEIKDGVPDIRHTWRWVSNFVDAVLDQVDVEMGRDGHMSHGTAWRLQQALLAALVSGRYCPPPRIHVLTSLIHPAYNGKIPCQDRDCQRGAACMGNHLELYQRDGGESTEVAADHYAEEGDAGTSSGSSLHFTGRNADDTDEDNTNGGDAEQDGGPEEPAGEAVQADGDHVDADGIVNAVGGETWADHGAGGEPDGEGDEPHGEYMAYGDWKHFDYDTTGVTHFVAHHKNDRLVP